MLEAKQISGDYSYYEQSPVTKRKKNTKTKKTGMMQLRAVMVGSIFIAVIIGLMLTTTYAQITHKTDKIIQTKGEISDLQNANERLKLEIARLKSLDRIELIATTELGMVQPGINDIEYIAYENSQDAPKASAEAAEVKNVAEVKVGSRQKMHPVILAINKMITNYAFQIRQSGTE